MNKLMLRSWISAGYAVANAGDGAWAWTVKGRTIPPYVRTLLSDLLYEGDPSSLGKVPAYLIRGILPELKQFGFDQAGFYQAK